MHILLGGTAHVKDRADYWIVTVPGTRFPARFVQAPPAADTFSYSTQPGQNFRKKTVLLVQNGATAYIQFNLSSLPANASVDKAVLRLFVDTVGQNGSIDAFEIEAPGQKPG